MTINTDLFAQLKRRLHNLTDYVRKPDMASKKTKGQKTNEKCTGSVDEGV